MASKETEVKTTSKRTTRKKSTASTKKAAPSVVEGEIVEAAKVKPKRNIVLSDNGDVNLSLINKEDKKRYTQIASSLNENDMTSIMNYGSDLQNAMDAYSNDFLNQRFDSNSSIKSAELIANLLGELQEVDIAELNEPSTFKRFIRRIPLLKKFVTSVEQIKAKYNTIQKNIDGITQKLEQTRLIAIRDNNLLEKQFQNNLSYVSQLGELIIAGKMKSKELEDEISTMKEESYNYNDYEIRKVEDFKNNLDKKITDLVMMRYSFQQSLVQINIIQQTNTQDAQNTEMQIKTTIPIWKNQMSMAVALYNQKKSIEASNLVTNTTNEILRRNSEMMKTQAIEVAKQSQRTVIDIETLEKTHKDLIATIEGVEKAQEEGRAKRAAAERRIKELERDMHVKALGIKESTERVIAKELVGIGSEQQ